MTNNRLAVIVSNGRNGTSAISTNTRDVRHHIFCVLRKYAIVFSDYLLCTRKQSGCSRIVSKALPDGIDRFDV